MTIDAIRLIATVLIGGLAVELATRLLARVHPESYFGMSELIRGLDRDLSWRGFAVRLAIPFAAGACAGLLNPEARAAAGAAAAGLGALLAVWPPLIHDHLLPDGAWDRRSEVRVVYVFYVIAYLLLGLAGGALAGRAMEEFGPTGIARWFAEAEIPSLAEIITSVIAGLIGALILGVVRSLAKRLKDRSE